MAGSVSDRGNLTAAAAPERRDRRPVGPGGKSIALIGAMAIAMALAVGPPSAVGQSPVATRSLAATLPSANEPAETQRLWLSGRGSGDALEWRFRCTDGPGCGAWQPLPVPSQWELHGFGVYNYGHDERPGSESGSYERRFEVPAKWRDRSVFLVFEGVMTDALAKVNGRQAGDTHQGGFYRFRYDVSDLLSYSDTNLLEVEVSKRSADRSVNRAEREADYWVFGGIFRPVYLEAAPLEHLAAIAIDADGDGRIQLDLTAAGLTSAAEVGAEIIDSDDRVLAVLSGSIVPDGDLGEGFATLSGQVAGIEPWSAEEPNLYRLRTSLLRHGATLHRETSTFGFRTVELRPGRGLFINGSPVRLKGINRHAFWPSSGRVTDVEVSVKDVELIRAMNMNAVRTAHYPPDSHFLEACDRLGLYVIDELAGWHDAYDTGVGSKLVEAMVTRDRNHPSVVLWSNGNEDGWNTDLDPLFGRFDRQTRPLIHPRGRFGGFDTFHYPTYGELESLLRREEERGDRGLLVMPTEFLHGLYDGGHGAGLRDFWELLRASPIAVGGFLWSLFDEAVVRVDEGGRLDTDGNHAPDGILGPYREPEGSFAAARQVFAPVRVALGGRSGATLELEIENDYDFLDLENLIFSWQLLRFPGPLEGAEEHQVIAAGALVSPSIAARGAGTMEVDLPDVAAEADAWRLVVSESDGSVVTSWQHLLVDRREYSRRVVARKGGPVVASQGDRQWTMRAGETEVVIDPGSGLLESLSLGGRKFPLEAGPRSVSGTSRLVSIGQRAEPDAHVVSARFEGDLELVIWRLYGSGWLQILYQYSASGAADYFGVGFDLEEPLIRGLRWLGEGPYRVWGNRRGAQALDLWSKRYNDTVTGQSWTYPEFKGYHSEPYWARIETTALDLIVVLADPKIDLQLLAPSPWNDPRYATAEFPDTGLGLLHAIPAIGTKFHPAGDLGPSGETPGGAGAYRGVVYLRLESPLGDRPAAGRRPFANKERTR